MLRSPGALVLSQPNGACPRSIFWHYARYRPARLTVPASPSLPKPLSRDPAVGSEARESECSGLKRRSRLGGRWPSERISAWWGRGDCSPERFAHGCLLRLPLLRAFASRPADPFLVVILVRKGS